MKIYDISVPISESVPIYAGDPKAKIDICKSIANGDGANVSQMYLGMHTGTHVDAPNHFIEGTRRVDQLDLDKLIGNCRVIGIDESVTAIEPQHLGDLTNVERVLFKTRNSGFWNEPEKAFARILHTLRRKPLARWSPAVLNLSESIIYQSKNSVRRATRRT